MGEIKPLVGEKVTHLPGTDDDERREQARAARARFVGSIAGAKLRSEELPRELLKVLPFAVANLMMVKVLTGEVPVKTASEASQVARAAVEIGRLEMGDAINAEPLTAEERAGRAAELAAVVQAIKDEREKHEAEAAGVPADAMPVPRDQSATAAGP